MVYWSMTTNEREKYMTEPLTEGQLNALMSPLNPARVQKRDGMSYLAAWDVKATLIRVFGFGGFSAEVIQSEILLRQQVPQVRNKDKMNWKVAAQATVRLTIHQTGAVYTETAVAGSAQPDITESMDMALKSAESDALKRAAIYLGTQFGLSLYDDGATSDVIRRVLAPGQEWPREQDLTPEQKEALERSLGMKGDLPERDINYDVGEDDINR